LGLALERTSESKDTSNPYYSSAALNPKFANEPCHNACANFGFAALVPVPAAARTPIRETAENSAAYITGRGAAQPPVCLGIMV